MKNLAQALANFHAECPTIEKNQKGAWGKYADLTSIMATVRPLLSKHGLTIMQPLESREDGTYVATYLFHISGDSMSSSIRIDYKAQNAQQLGALVSYYRRYSINSILCLAADEDVDDGAKIGQKDHPFPEKSVPKLSQSQVRVINEMLDTPELFEWFKGSIAKLGITDLKDLEASRYSAVVKFIKDYKEANCE